MKPATYEELDKATCKWLKSARDRNVPVGANVLKLKALEFAKKLDLENFHASDGSMEKTIQCQCQNYIRYVLVYKAGI